MNRITGLFSSGCQWVSEKAVLPVFKAALDFTSSTLLAQVEATDGLARGVMVPVAQDAAKALKKNENVRKLTTLLTQGELGQILLQGSTQLIQRLTAEQIGSLLALYAYSQVGGPTTQALISAVCALACFNKVKNNHVDAKAMAAGTLAALTCIGAGMGGPQGAQLTRLAGQTAFSVLGGWLGHQAVGGEQDLASYGANAVLGQLTVGIALPKAASLVQQAVRDPFYTALVANQQQIRALGRALKNPGGQIERVMIGQLDDQKSKPFCIARLAEKVLGAQIYATVLARASSTLDKLTDPALTPLFRSIGQILASKLTSSAKGISQEIGHFFIKGLDVFALQMKLSGSIALAHEKFKQNPSDPKAYADLKEAVLNVLDESPAYRPLYADLKMKIETTVSSQLQVMDRYLGKDFFLSDEKAYIEKMVLLFFTAYIPFFVTQAPNLMQGVSMAEDDRFVRNVASGVHLLLEPTSLKPVGQAAQQAGEAVVVVKQRVEALRIELLPESDKYLKVSNLTFSQKVKGFFMNVSLLLYAIISKLRSLFD